MSLSNQVKESVNEAAGNLREALAFAARTEHPVVIDERIKEKSGAAVAFVVVFFAVGPGFNDDRTIKTS